MHNKTGKLLRSLTWNEHVMHVKYATYVIETTCQVPNVPNDNYN
jgi:hypothetical protein